MIGPKTEQPKGDPKDTTDTKVVQRLEKLAQFRELIRESTVFSSTKASVQDFSIKKIRCLALGSPLESTAALYQLAYLVELKEMFSCHVTAYDPVFSTQDDEILHAEGIENIEHDKDDLSAPNTLYFLPHADLSVTEQLVKQQQPMLLLGNDVVAHTNRMTKRELHDKYVTLSHMVDIVEKSSTGGNKEQEFTTVKAKKRAKNRFVPPQIDFDHKSMYFTSIKVIPIGEYGEWSNAFNDLSLHIIEREEAQEVGREELKEHTDKVDNLLHTESQKKEEPTTGQ